MKLIVSTVTCFLLQSVSPFGVDRLSSRPSLSLKMSTMTIPSGSGMSSGVVSDELDVPDAITLEHPLRVVVAGAGIGGLALANDLCKKAKEEGLPIQVTVLEQTSEFRRFGGPIQLASNALEAMKTIDKDVYANIMEKFTFTGDKTNGIKDGKRTEWYAKFDLASPAERRNMPYTGVIDRSDLQQIQLNALPAGTVRTGDKVVEYEKVKSKDGRSRLVKVRTKSGKEMYADVLIGADGIWSEVRATMRGSAARGEESGATYSGYTVYAGELHYDSPDHGEVGYKVYIGPNQYFVITDIGQGRYQWYAFLARPPNSAETESKPNGSSAYLQGIFDGWSEEIHSILRVTKEEEIEQRDLYDRPPSVFQPWTDGHVALLGDGVHAMMPNLGQGGCQAIEDALVVSQELRRATKRSQLNDALRHYQTRRLIRSAAVQGLSRFASDIIIRGFDTPAKITRDASGKLVFENFNYAGIVTRMMQPILPLFFTVQFNFLYAGWKNEELIDVEAAAGFLLIGGLFLLALL
ncbi:zeaxanthin epoxidase [Fistulifera solaris]|uniref:Zeaxanthin epoxidase n=1 Tax=Fistulifera solaris TaxID=1519565 RepID=A0A1Z5KJ73_FISSO|nr:zeaxanthin epoxidase [Fistulifera solaris]|eukprot:GAX26333.1 zeaxanthin epoxidase [Fistulifera solaris]